MRSRGEPVKNGQLTNYVTWTAVMDHVLCSEELNIVVTKANVQNRLRTLSRHYSINANILQHPSFSWEHDKNRLKVANESAWIEYCESHPDARPYRKMVIENWEDICTIFAQDEAIGDNAQTPTEVDVDMIHKDSNDAEESKETAGSNDAVSDYNYVSECTKSPSRVKGGRRRQTSKYLAWATDMARVLINQLNLGISWDYQRHRLKVSSESSWNDY
ncbi:Myb/SANT-like domain [Dillenia turbinata]|uniref:Myb/SANT-like domain n=1 Tax=Dillenia turbinata TaxID=194707 RepID=A0AAN8Z1V6_9MAGN